MDSPLDLEPGWSQARRAMINNTAVSFRVCSWFVPRPFFFVFIDIPTSFLEERFFHNSRSILADFCWIFEFLLSKFNRQFPNIQFHFLPVLKAPYHSIRPRPECRGSHFIVLLILKDIPASFLENITFAQMPLPLAMGYRGRNLFLTLSITLTISTALPVLRSSSIAESASLKHPIPTMRPRLPGRNLTHS